MAAYEKLLAEVAGLRVASQVHAAQLDMLCSRLGGTVEGQPTCELNFLQRVDELVRIEGEASLSRNAFDVMMRRGWWAWCDSEKWFVDGEGTRILYHKVGPGALVEPQDQPPWSDPFTALVEAEAWYKANVEQA